MVVSKLTRGGIVGVLMGWASRLRFPYLLLLTTCLFLANVFIPDALPFVDELVLGLVTVLLVKLKKRPPEDPPEIPPAQES